MKEMDEDEPKYLKALTASYPKIAFSKSQKDLEDTLSKAAEKGDGTKWASQTFKEKTSAIRMTRKKPLVWVDRFGQNSRSS
ncbi:10041_t:CDS:2 [Rhizophagus irregularis]|nr:10041_t:CDS:2 [Rhizophagus irregularis]